MLGTAGARGDLFWTQITVGRVQRPLAYSSRGEPSQVSSSDCEEEDADVSQGSTAPDPLGSHEAETPQDGSPFAGEESLEMLGVVPQKATKGAIWPGRAQRLWMHSVLQAARERCSGGGQWWREALPNAGTRIKQIIFNKRNNHCFSLTALYTCLSFGTLGGPRPRRRG